MTEAVMAACRGRGLATEDACNKIRMRRVAAAFCFNDMVPVRKYCILA
jgi:hypothetical protein